MDILNYGAQLLRDHFGGDLDIGAVADALKGLLGEQGGELDLTGLAGRFAQSG